MQVSLIGIDLAKSVFQLCAINQAHKVVFNRQVSRGKLLAELRNHAGVPIVMEACGSAHFWGRTLQALGHDVRLVPPQLVKPFVRSNKSDARDALAICEATFRPDIHFVPVKSVEQQDLQLLQRVRSRYVRSRTAQGNQIRSIAAEYGVIFPQSLKALRTALPLALEDAGNNLTAVARRTLADLSDELRAIDEKIDALTEQMMDLARQFEAYDRLQSVPGVGPVIAAALLAAIGSGQQFQCGRDCAAWLGLVPRQTGTGGKLRLLNISKRGDRELRTLLIHGARTVLRWSDRRTDSMTRWARSVKERRGHNKAVVALANKLARIVWRVIHEGEGFDPKKAAA